jgi:DTW domain-containing protein YfiP
VGLLVLQHPLEVGQAKGSARLLQLSLQHCRTAVGETFAPATLAAWLAAPTAAGPVHCMLLYPPAAVGTAPRQSAEAAAAPPSLPAPPVQTGQLRLVLLDGTWRKTRKMLALNPLLQALPRWWLAAPPPSRYHIRRAQQADQRSTLEAACLALGALEAQPARYAPLLAAFDAWCGRQAALAPERRPHCPPHCPRP